MTEPTYVPPAHQTATFDQGYAAISTTINELIAAYHRVRAQNAATREIDIAGLVEFLKDSPNDREQFIEHYVVAVVRLAEQEQRGRGQFDRVAYVRAATDIAAGDAVFYEETE